MMLSNSLLKNSIRGRVPDRDYVAGFDRVCENGMCRQKTKREMRKKITSQQINVMSL